MSKGLDFVLSRVVGGLSHRHVYAKHTHTIYVSPLYDVYYNTICVMFEISGNNVHYLKAISCCLGDDDEGYVM